MNAAPEWKVCREHLVLFHGCTDLDRLAMESGAIDASRGRPNTDFGRGFYTTTLIRQARHWAFQRYDEPGVATKNNGPVVLSFTIPRLAVAGLQTLSFVRGDYDAEGYWSLVQHCRASTAPKGRPPVIYDHVGPVAEAGFCWYDIVVGPVAANWKQREAFRDMDQVSFHTRAAVDLLNLAMHAGDPGRYSWQTV